LPTDDYKQALEALLNEPWGRRAVRLAVGIGRDADQDVLQQFIADDELEPLSASSPEQLIRMIRWASTHASRVASSPVPSRRFGPVAQSIGRDAANELTW
jgi:uncharacterized protein YegL